MKKVFLFFISLFLLNACSFDTNQNQGKIGQIGAEISAKDTLGKAVKLADDKSNIKVLVFFQNGCPSCLQELPSLDKFMQEHPNKISVYAINSVDKAEVVQVLAEQLNFKNIKVLTDDLKITNDRYAVFSTPTTIILKDGIIKERILGEKPWQTFESKLISLL
ncbi:TlpA family protein disulfide reductase [Campylobacter coli]|uniref:TlpA family protein disulfide reductase n=1 Tax=Campylobacter coli TaxID=195 RepID=UPI00092FB7C1|nr:TlpA disulfide reductase family protein [Campylobacter coli]HEB9308254.1 TlpA family protein disulfide reductase [Campylobacter coli]HEB9323266.1 TlpA family protein disulfide reductase [Campylobacter coli]